MNETEKYFRYVEEMSEHNIIGFSCNKSCFCCDVIKPIMIHVADCETVEKFGGEPFIYVKPYAKYEYLAVDVSEKHRAFCLLDRKSENEWMKHHPNTKWYKEGENYMFKEMTPEEVSEYRGIF